MISKDELLTKLRIIKQYDDEVTQHCSVFFMDLTAKSNLPEDLLRTLSGIFKKLKQDEQEHGRLLSEIECRVKESAENVF
jgi:hypothetical protein